MGSRDWQTTHVQKTCDRCGHEDKHDQGDPFPVGWDMWMTFSLKVDPSPNNPIGTSADYLMCPTCRGTVEYVMFEGRPAPNITSYGDQTVAIPASRVAFNDEDWRKAKAKAMRSVSFLDPKHMVKVGGEDDSA